MEYNKEREREKERERDSHLATKWHKFKVKPYKDFS
jgi:hypothetical protein